MNIYISKETEKAILDLDKYYYFGLFKEITKTEEDEYKFRDAIIEIAKSINESNKNKK